MKTTVHLALILLLSLLNLGLGFWIALRQRHAPLAQRSRSHQIVLAALSLYLFYLLALPRTRFVHWGGFVDLKGTQVIGLRLLLLVAFLVGTISLLWSTHTTPRLWNFLAQRRSLWVDPWLWGGWFIAITSFLTLLITGLGIKSTLNWYEPAVPLLPEQLFLALLLVGVAPKRLPVSPKSRILFGGLIWLSTFSWWALTPQAGSFFAPGPTLPGNMFFPWSDAATLDLTAWQIDLGLKPDPFTDHLGYSALLAILHRFTGTNYEWLTLAHLGVMALIPTLLFLIGTSVHSPSAGLILAWLASAQGHNAIQAGELMNQVNPALLMTEYPTQLVLLIMSLAFIWLAEAKDIKSLLGSAWLLGASTGLGILFRLNLLLFLPFILLAPIFPSTRPKISHRLLALSVLLLALAGTLGPWMHRSQVRAGTPWFFLDKIKGVVGQRSVQAPPLQQEAPEIVNTKGKAFSSMRAFPKTQSVERSFPLIAQLNIWIQLWLHNWVVNLFELPPLGRFDPLEGLIAKHPFYRAGWYHPENTGEIPLLDLFTYAVYLLMIVIGWRRLKQNGWLYAMWPFVIMATYYASTAFAHTSGGRYIVPAHWGMWLYWSIGLAELAHPYSLNSIRVNSPSSMSQADRVGFSWLWGAASSALLITIAVFPAWADATFRPWYSEKGNGAREQLTQAIVFLPQPQQEKILSFLNSSENVQVLRGFMLYPRYYPADEGIPEAKDGYRPLPFPRLATTMLYKWGWHGWVDVVLPVEEFSIQNPTALMGDAFTVGHLFRSPQNKPMFCALLVIYPSTHLVIASQEPDSTCDFIPP